MTNITLHVLLDSFLLDLGVDKLLVPRPEWFSFRIVHVASAVHARSTHFIRRRGRGAEGTGVQRRVEIHFSYIKG